MDNMDSEVLLMLLPKEYKYKIYNAKILANSDVFEEQCFKASFEVNICDKEKADEFVEIFGKMNGLGFQQKGKKKTGFISRSFACCIKVREQRTYGYTYGAGKVGQGRRKGVE